MRKTILSISLAISILASCTKEELRTAGSLPSSKSDDLELFAILLSRALYSEPDLRNYVRSEALKKKDYDYDVFYPYVRNELVDGERTFEQILSEYDRDGILKGVISNHPLLTILVPDWSWVNDDCFSARKWDSYIPDVGVSYLSESSSHDIYWNGEFAFSLEEGEFSSAPILIVKDNDRLVADSQTKTPYGPSYRFFSSDFTDLSVDNKAETKATSTYTTYYLPYEVATNTIDLNVLTNRTATAYGVCSTDDRIFQRDHIYYGMTSTIDSSSVNPNYYETLYRFKLSPDAYGLTDDPRGTGTGNDFKTNTYYYEANIWGNATQLTQAQLESKVWGYGAAELKIKIYLGDQVIRKDVSVGFTDAFYAKKVVLRENFNVLGALKSRTYYIGIGNSGTNSEWLEPKWINANLQLFHWDLSSFPTKYYIDFEEYDEATRDVRTFQESYSFATNITTSVEGSATGDGTAIKIGYGCGVSNTVTYSYTHTVETTQSSDMLGSFIVQYNDKIVLSQDNSTATLKTYSTGAVDAQILVLYE